MRLPPRLDPLPPLLIVVEVPVLAAVEDEWTDVRIDTDGDDLADEDQMIARFVSGCDAAVEIFSRSFENRRSGNRVEVRQLCERSLPDRPVP